MHFSLDHDEHVDTHECGKHHDDVKQISSCQNYTKISHVFRDDLILKGVEAKSTGLLHIIEAFGAFVHGLLGKSNKERHENHW